MDKQAFLRLLQNYLDGNVTEEQKTLIEAYYLQFEQDPSGIAPRAGSTFKMVQVGRIQSSSCGSSCSIGIGMDLLLGPSV